MKALMLSLLLSAPAEARDGAQLLNDLKGLSVVGTALYVAAHPDDENTRLLGSLANEMKFRTAYLSLTRGEGGQNLIGPELGPLLGVIRTQELLAARRVDGAEQYFTRARDFGYSKSVDETMAIWAGKPDSIPDDVLADAVFVIRSLRPDLIITRFSPLPGTTHGHHTASAKLAVLAFRAAADPTFHPEQLDRVQVWQAKRIVWNAWAPDPAFKPPEGSVTWDSSQFSPLLGYSYGELAATSRSMHKSQGFGAAPVHEGSVEYFAPLDGDVAKKSLFEGLDTSWKRVAGSEKFSGLLEKATAEFKVDAPAKSIPTLLLALEALRALPANPWKERKLDQLTDLIANCAGLFVQASATTTSVVPGAKLKLDVMALERSGTPITLDAVTVGTASLTPATVLERGKPAKLSVELDVTASLSSPYFLDLPPQKGTWGVAPTQPIGAPELPSPFIVEYRFSSAGHTFSLRRPATFRWTDPTVGERHRPIEVLPPVVARANTELLVFTDLTAKVVEVTLSANTDSQRGEVKLDVPAGFVCEPATAPYALDKKGTDTKVIFKVKPASKTAPTTGAFSVLLDGAPAKTLTRVEYAHIPIQTVLTAAQVKLLRVDLRRGKTTRVGYIVGAGDDVPAALTQAGYEVTLLNDELLRTGALERFDAIVVGVRAYNVNPKLPAVYERLMQYVKNGGTLVAQYNTKNWLSSVPATIGPLPFELSQDRVTDEDAVVTRDAHLLLKSPNTIGDDDFTGWVQERGLYFANSWDSHYETPLSLNDRGEKPSKGSLLFLRHGKGRFIYTGLSFFRQLPAGVPGAYRLFANLLDHGT